MEHQQPQVERVVYELTPHQVRTVKQIETDRAIKMSVLLSSIGVPEGAVYQVSQDFSTIVEVRPLPSTTQERES